MIIFKPTTRYGTRNNIDELERRMTREGTTKVSIFQIRCNGQIYNLILPLYIMPSISQRGSCTIKEERRATAQDYMRAQMRCKPLTSDRILVNEHRTYEILPSPNRQLSCPILYIDNH